MKHAFHSWIEGLFSVDDVKCKVYIKFWCNFRVSLCSVPLLDVTKFVWFCFILFACYPYTPQLSIPNFLYNFQKANFKFHFDSTRFSALKQCMYFVQFSEQSNIISLQHLTDWFFWWRRIAYCAMQTQSL